MHTFRLVGHDVDVHFLDVHSLRPILYKVACHAHSGRRRHRAYKSTGLTPLPCRLRRRGPSRSGDYIVSGRLVSHQSTTAFIREYFAT